MNYLLSFLSVPFDIVLKSLQIEKKILEKMEKKKAKFYVNVESRSTSHCDKILIIENVGESNAMNVEFTIQTKEGQNIFFTEDSKKTLNANLINSKSKMSFAFVIAIGSGSSFDLLIKWSDKYKNDNSELRSVSYTW